MILETGSLVNRRAGFTLVELVVVVVVLGVMAAMAIPSVDGLLDERRAREPVSSLLTMAREVRLRALKEQRPYQIFFDQDGFRSSRYFNPYGGVAEFDALQDQLRVRKAEQEYVAASLRRSGLGAETTASGTKPEVVAASGLSFTDEYSVTESIDYSVRAWRDTQWRTMEGGNFFRWVFQPSGVCDPIKVQFKYDNAFFEVEFHPLTADIRDETSWVE